MKTGIFFTGGAGLLALNGAASLREAFNVTLAINKRKVNLKNTESLILNLASPDSIECSLEKIQPDLVIHTAGLTNIETCESDPILAKHVNVDLAKNVAVVCSRLKIPLAHISTDHLFDGKKSFVDEACPLNPLNVYSKTKAEAEHIVLDSYPQALVIRTNFYGWGTLYRFSFSDLVIKSLRSGKKISLFKDIYFTPLLAENLINIICEIAKKNASGIFNIVGDDRISKYDFGLRLADYFKLDKNLITSGYMVDQISLVKRPFDMSLSNQKVSDFLDATIGGIDQHIIRLKQQEEDGLAQEFYKL